jgi:lipoprotein-releasing system permease protein
VLDWRQLNPSLFNAIEVERNVMFIILTLIIIVAAFNLISSMMILVSTKTKDIGILRVLGVSRFQLLKIFIINGLLIGLLGTISGLILGLLFCLNINEIKSFIELFSGTNLFSEEIYFFSNLPIIIDLNQIIIISSISLLLSFFATIYPSIKASKVEPINLIKWE